MTTLAGLKRRLMKDPAFRAEDRKAAEEYALVLPKPAPSTGRQTKAAKRR